MDFLRGHSGQTQKSLKVSANAYCTKLNSYVLISMGDTFQFE